MIQVLAGANRVSYRRLLAFLVGSGLLVGGYIDGGVWEMVTMVFIGAELGEKVWARGKNQS